VDVDFMPNPDGVVNSIALRVEGSIYVGGVFSEVAGVTSPGLALLSSDGGLAQAFNPGTSSTVTSVLIQADGEVLISGNFTQFMGEPRSRLARLAPPQAALQRLEADEAGLRWMRSGAGPEFGSAPRLLLASEVGGFIPAGELERIVGGWRYEGFIDAPRQHSSGETERKPPWWLSWGIIEPGSEPGYRSGSRPWGVC